MFKTILLFSSGIVLSFAQEISTDGDESGNACKDTCSTKNCNTWATDDHPCSGWDFRTGGAIVDVWKCSSQRCRETTCDRCGDRDKCVDLCEENKQQMREDGYDLSSGYPDCAFECASVNVDDDFVCFPDCFPEKGTETNECINWWPCTEAVCGASGQRTCSAQLNMVDPWNDMDDEPCKPIPCSRCGGQSICMAFCTAHNEKRSEDEQVNCKTECASVAGYKCIWTPFTSEEDEALIEAAVGARLVLERLSEELQEDLEDPLSAQNPPRKPRGKAHGRGKKQSQTTHHARTVLGNAFKCVSLGLALAALVSICKYVYHETTDFKYIPIE